MWVVVTFTMIDRKNDDFRKYYFLKRKSPLHVNCFLKWKTTRNLVSRDVALFLQFCEPLASGLVEGAAASQVCVRLSPAVVCRLSWSMKRICILQKCCEEGRCLQAPGILGLHLEACSGRHFNPHILKYTENMTGKEETSLNTVD